VGVIADVEVAVVTVGIGGGEEESSEGRIGERHGREVSERQRTSHEVDVVESTIDHD
jgi:hypothetical protein